MKIIYILNLCISFLLLDIFNSFAGTSYTFNQSSSTSWATSTNWTPTGVPAKGDDVTIPAGKTCAMNGTKEINNLTIQGVLSKTSSYILTVDGDISNTGTISGSGTGAINFSGSSKTISGSGTWQATAAEPWIFSVNTTIASDVTISKNDYLQINSCTVTSTGSVTLKNNSLTTSGNGTWINDVNSILQVNLVMASHITLTATASGNTVKYAGSTYVIQNPTSSTYYSLTVQTSGTKSLPADIIVSGDLSIASSTTLDVVSGKNYGLTVSGNWDNEGTFTARSGTVTFNGSSGTQTLYSGASSFNNILHNGAGTLQITSNLATGGTFTNSTGTFDANSLAHTVTGLTTISGGTYLASTAAQTFNGALTVNGGTFTGSSGTVSTTSVTVSSGILTAPSSTGTFNVSNNFTVNSGATFAHNSGKVTFNGAGAQAIGGSAAKITFNNLKFSNSVTSNLPLDIIDSVVVAALKTFTTGANAITLISNAGATARIGNSAGSISGSNWIVQRYADAASADLLWQDISTPINGNNLSDWDNELYMSISSLCPDGLAGSFLSVWDWNEGTQAYESIVTCNQALGVTTGYEIWLATSLGHLNATIFDSRGTPSFGNKAATLASGVGNWSLIGNPYASGIDWKRVYAGATGLDDFFQVFDETIGDYATWDPTGSFGGSTGKLVSCNGIIPSTQGFYVQNSGASPTLTFQESYKTNINKSLERTINNPIQNILKMRLHTSMMNNACEASIRIDDNAVENFEVSSDIAYRKSPDKRTPALTPVSTDGIRTRAKAVPAKPSLSIPVIATINVPGIYTIDFTNVNTIYKYNCIILEDTQTGISFPLYSDKSYSFSQTDISKARTFILHFSNSTKCEPTPSSEENMVHVFAVKEGVSLNFNFDVPTNAQVSICNILGQNILNRNFNTEKENIVLPLPESGQIYFVKVTTAQGVSTYKIFY